jgi:hypothetical protein
MILLVSCGEYIALALSEWMCLRELQFGFDLYSFGIRRASRFALNCLRQIFAIIVTSVVLLFPLPSWGLWYYYLGGADSCRFTRTTKDPTTTTA